MVSLNLLSVTSQGPWHQCTDAEWKAIAVPKLQFRNRVLLCFCMTLTAHGLHNLVILVLSQLLVCHSQVAKQLQATPAALINKAGRVLQLPSMLAQVCVCILWQNRLEVHDHFFGNLCFGCSLLQVQGALTKVRQDYATMLWGQAPQHLQRSNITLQNTVDFSQMQVWPGKQHSKLSWCHAETMKEYIVSQASHPFVAQVFWTLAILLLLVWPKVMRKVCILINSAAYLSLLSGQYRAVPRQCRAVTRQCKKARCMQVADTMEPSIDHKVIRESKAAKHALQVQQWWDCMTSNLSLTHDADWCSKLATSLKILTLHITMPPMTASDSRRDATNDNNMYAMTHNKKAKQTC